MADEQLVVADNARITAALVKPELMDQLLEEIKGKLVEFKGDISTDKGRKEIASVAYRVARTKTTIDNFGKELVGAAKAEIKKIDDVRKKAWDTLDRYKDVVRKPLTDWEAEQAMAQGQIDRIIAMGEIILTNCEYGEGLITDLQLLDAGKIPENLRPYFEEVVAAAIAKLKDAVVAQRTREEEAAELDRLRKQEAERIAKEKHDAEVAAAVAEKMRLHEIAMQAEVDAFKKRAEEAEAAKEAAAVEAEVAASIDAASRFGVAAPAPVQQAPVAPKAAPPPPGAIAPIASPKSVAMNAAFQDIVNLGGIDRNAVIRIVKAIADGKIRNVTISW